MPLNENFFDYIEKTRAITKAYNKTPNAYIRTYGCQQNFSDSEKIAGMLEKMGFMTSESEDDADIIIFNTCAVRENAEDRVFGNIGALKHLKKKKKDLKIILCGCMVQQEQVSKRLKSKFPFIDLIFGTHAIDEFPKLMYELLFDEKKQIFLPEFSDYSISEGIPVKRSSSFSASVTVMYGCNNFCTYCIVPHVRGRERSRKPENIINEVEELLKNGVKDILLLGQNVNSYGKELGVTFAELLYKLDNLPYEYRLSYMTSHPKDLSTEMIDVIANSKNISYHIHLPVQAGSNRILTQMNRHYTREHYINLVAEIREKIPECALTSDIIVGFPGETYCEFSETLSLIREVKFDSLFTFIYSRREGTSAAKMDDPISPEEKGIWFRELLDLQTEVCGGAYKRFKDKTLRVLCTGVGRTDEKMMTGKSRHNIIVDFPGNETMIGKFIDVKITKVLSWAVIGEII